MKVVVIGRGRVGSGLVRALQAASVDVALAPGRECDEASVKGADVVVLAVSDGAIAECAGRIAPWLPADASVLHCAGARTAQELGACRAVGARVGVMHPLASFPDARHPPALEGTTFAIAGDPRAVGAAEGLARELGAVPLTLPVHGPVYHALAALTANGTVALVNAVVPALERLGLTRTQAQEAVAALLRTVADNVRAIGVPRALTGPMMRGDAETVAAHRRTLAQTEEGAAAAYQAVAPIILRCAVANGLSRERANAIAEVIRSETDCGELHKRS